MDKSIRRFTLVFFILALTATLLGSFFKPAIGQLIENPLSLVDRKEEEEHSTDGLPIPISVDFPDVVELPKLKGKVAKDAYEDHLTAAENNGVGIIETKERLDELIESEQLVELNRGKGYNVEPLTHSHPYVTPQSKKIVEEMGLMYEILAGDGSFFSISSATRTMNQQVNLKKRNRNATAGNSSHSFGVSFDISYIRFNGKRAWDQKAQRNLEKVLNHFQEAGKIYVIKERKQSCYHVTVR
ncbi:MAG: hypothetical protein EP311_02505 [Cytophagales bacterium]|uniref:D-alanyl-D-alanine carboxypeptidase n=1 Tax=Algoriphagus taiwanensis TaxID=1445656 RepID=A0ABQ6PXK9_9BACT|nr:MAG: hypothetical protein EP311_02505 [Cytophagales bacterium]GMQ32683.1 hypothetical protein Ataiwa_09550 [Algoriphagus taiwanensis]